MSPVPRYRSYLLHAFLGAALAAAVLLGCRPALQLLDDASRALAIATQGAP